MVQVEFKVISFGEIREVNMEYSMDIFFRQWWKDPRMRHNSSTPFNVAVDPRNLIWTPDTYFWNVKNAKYHYVTRENMRLRISSDGEIYFSTRITVVAQCDMNLRLYPMDTQHCSLRIESYAHTVADVDYKWKGGKGVEIVSSEMAQFDLLRVVTENEASTNSKGSFAKLKAVFSFRRRLDYHISAVYVPEVILVVLSWCTFFITPTAVPARVSLSITTILTTILLSSSVNSDIPKVSYMKAVDYFMLTSFGFIFAALIEYIIVLNTPNELVDCCNCGKKKRKDEPVQGQDGTEELILKISASPRKLNLPKPIKPAEKKPTNNKDHWVDKLSRVLFPALYALFLMAYVAYYKSMD
ncbi:gamma-aminobutyric acid receptor subunit alpha-2-like isoform X2 [Oculina patagonica]